MKLFVKKKGEDLYLTPDGFWTPKMVEAQDFRGIVNASEFCQENQTANVEALYSFEASEFNFTVTLGPGLRKPAVRAGNREESARYRATG